MTRKRQMRTAAPQDFSRARGVRSRRGAPRWARVLALLIAITVAVPAVINLLPLAGEEVIGVTPVGEWVWQVSPQPEGTATLADAEPDQASEAPGIVPE